MHLSCKCASEFAPEGPEAQRTCHISHITLGFTSQEVILRAIFSSGALNQRSCQAVGLYTSLIVLSDIYIDLSDSPINLR
jgi:hypothetical protein